MHVDDPDGDSLLRQQVGGLQGHLDHHAHSHNGHILAVPQEHALADLEVIALHPVGDGLHRQAAQAHVGGAVIVQQSLHRLPHLVAVAGAQNRHVGDSPHDGQVLNALVGGAVLAHGQAAVGADDLHVQARVSHAVADLLKGPAGGEHSKGVDKGLLAAGGQAGSHTNHVGLSDAHVKKAVRMSSAKVLGHGGAGQVRVQDHQVGFLLGQFHQRLAVSGAGRNLICHLTCPPFLPGRPPARPGPADTALRWAPCRASRRCSP